MNNHRANRNVRFVDEHFCNEPFRCIACQRAFFAWAEARTNAPPRRGQGDVSFYACVNVIRSPVRIEE